MNEIIETKGLKFDNNKRRFTLLDVDFINGMIDVMEVGAKKYGDFNWHYTVNENNGYERYQNAIYRHFAAYLQGEFEDPEDKLHPLLHIACNAMILYWYENQL